ncbi:helix-turn-helix domain-containing protein [Aliarcobacter cryaerophilus]|jgi:hypothetical protein|uniref:helix-turn-helix domain-containing protein n=1 Tax=Aliarcobacter cryaerophilus TaxID=28198 RepID=UPI0021B31D1A|nr:helix-turn-helix domain-containing protein [Aliarcobacter cryaerophilus]MCT7526337.1 helix-turn-helix domain-containing protein [Aliarcobacter cryaerophilus]MCT7541348.1 helix-turn-helix domain-containing protein [Aliarcobacter cryaerophilus]
MLLEKKELTKLRKSAEKKLNEKIEKIKFFSINTITNEIDNIQLSYENEDYTFFANIADDIIFSNASDEYKDDFSTHEHNENVLELAKLITQDYIVKLKILIQNNYLILDSEKNTLEQIEKIKLTKEKEYLTQEEVSSIYQLKKDKLLELRTAKMLPYFQIEDNSKVLFKKKDIEEFMKKYTF